MPGTFNNRNNKNQILKTFFYIKCNLIVQTFTQNDMSRSLAQDYSNNKTIITQNINTDTKAKHEDN